MEDKNSRGSIPKKFIRIAGIFISVLLIVFEVIICVQYERSPNAQNWSLGLVVGLCVLLDVLCLLDLYCFKKMSTRIGIYSVDFIILLAVSTFTGNSYLAVLYCVILTELYMNVEELKTRIIIFSVSCIMFLITVIVGWFLMNVKTSANAVLDVVAGSITGLVAIIVHFLIVSLFIGIYQINVKLRKALKDAAESNRQLETAQDKLKETAVFEERNRIARDIHDNAGHSMTAVIMQTEAAKLLIDTSPEEAKKKIISANIQAKNALEQMRESVHLLAGRDTPRTLKEELEEILAQTMDGTDVKIRFDVEDAEISGDKRRFLANTLKELLSNGLRHGKATAFYVGFSAQGGIAELVVSDNGTGLDENFQEGFGLKGIRSKTAYFGGNMEYESEAGEGCEFKIIIPEDIKETDEK